MIATHYPRADIYRNLHLGRVTYGWSVRVGGLVKHHSDSVLVQNGEFVVGERARQTVIRTGCRSVHAFVRGKVLAIEGVTPPADIQWRRVSYNPYKAGHFYFSEPSEPVTSARAVIFTPDGCFVADPE
jgi:hypothetical protein